MFFGLEADDGGKGGKASGGSFHEGRERFAGGVELGEILPGRLRGERPPGARGLLGAEGRGHREERGKEGRSL